MYRSNRDSASIQHGTKFSSLLLSEVRTIILFVWKSQITFEILNDDPIELKIVSKLQLAGWISTTDCRDFEDALHLYLIFEDELKDPRLET